MCAKLPVEAKAIKILLGDGLRFFVAPHVSKKSSIVPSALEAVRLIGVAGGDHYATVDDAVKAGALDPERKVGVDLQLFEEILGVDLKVHISDHNLLGKTILRKWIDLSFHERVLYGTVDLCYKRKYCDIVSVEIKHDTRSMANVREMIPDRKFF